RLRGRRRGRGDLALAEQRHPGRDRAARDREGKEQQGDRGGGARAHRRASRSFARASRTAGQGSAGIRASTVYSFLSLRAPRLAAIVLSIRSGVTGVDGANVSTA